MTPELETGLKSRLQSWTFGIYDPQTFGISLHNMQSMVEAAQQGEKRISQLILETENRHLRPDEQHKSADELRDQIIAGAVDLHLTDEEYDFVQAVRAEHQRTFDFYYRIRVHEQSHWYTTISATVPVARFFTNQDLAHSLWSAIAKCRSGKIYLPLIKWMQRDECPRDLSGRISTFHIARLVDLAVDGEMPALEGWHLLTAYFPELASQGNFWATTPFKIGYRALLEGAGKASEWLYDLIKDPSIEERAWQDIDSSPMIYRLALSRLISSVPRLALKDYLQILSVLVDFSINPSIPPDRWPFLFGGAPAADLLPGIRYQRLLDILPRAPALRGVSKEEIAEYLTIATLEHYGWCGPSESTRQLTEVLNRAQSMLPDGSWNPLDTLRAALRVRAADPLAYVAPVNAALINASSTYPQLMITSPGTHAGSAAGTLTYFGMWYQGALLDALVYGDNSDCPCVRNEWFQHLVAMMGRCDHVTAHYRRGRPRENDMGSLLDCGMFRAYMTSRYGDFVERMCYLRTEQR